MTLLQLVREYWEGNSTLEESALPASKVYTGFAPEPLSFPYGIMFLVTATPEFTTCDSYLEESTLQIDIFDVSLANCEDLATMVMGELDWVAIDSSVIAMRRTNYQVFAESETTKPNQNVYHAMIEYSVLQNHSLSA